MSRKSAKSMMQGQRRRSPRISALDTSNQKQLSRINTSFDDAALPPLSKLPKQVWKGRDSPENADSVEWRSLKENEKHDDDDNVITNGDATEMPAKQILELVLDTLQRRDTYEIFAQPVDPDEVEDYYEIIKESMDFGTMRAKLHEGMYQNLQQFEHDVFLIPENAMRFNSSGTTYFRQARAIHDLANKVFHALKTNPENFVSEFSGTRRRSMRKALSETKDSAAAKSAQCPSTSTFRRSNRKTPPACPDRNLLTGTGDGMLSKSLVADRRDTYLSKKEDPVYSTTFPLILADVSYKDSIMWFAKDLGATAQMVAKRKLLGCQESNSREKCEKIEVKEFKTFRDFAPTAGSNPFVKASSKVIGFTKDGEEAKLRHGITKEKTAVAITIPIPSPRPKVTQTSTKKVIRNPSATVVRDLNSSSRPVVLALETYHSNKAEFKSRNKKSCILPKPISVCDEAAQQQQKPLPLLFKPVSVCDEAAQQQQKPLPSIFKPISVCDEAAQQQQKPLPSIFKPISVCDEAAQQQQKPSPSISQFTFDLPFLKARLDQMKAVEKKRSPSFGKGGLSIT